MPAEMKHEPVPMDPTPPDFLMWSLGTKLLTSAGPEYSLTTNGMFRKMHF